MIVPHMDRELATLAEKAITAAIDDDMNTALATIEKINSEYKSEGTLGAMIYWTRRFRDHMAGDVPAHLRDRIVIAPPGLISSRTGQMQSLDDPEVPPHVRWGVTFIHLVANGDIRGMYEHIDTLPEDVTDPMLGNSIWAVCHLAGWSIRNLPRGVGRMGMDPEDEVMLQTEPHPVELCTPSLHGEQPPPELLPAADQSWAELTPEERAAVHRVGCLGQEGDEKDRAVAQLFVERAGNIVRANRANATSTTGLPLTVLSPTERELREKLGKPTDVLSVGLPEDMIPDRTGPELLALLKDATCVDCGVNCKIDPGSYPVTPQDIICVRCAGKAISKAQANALGLPDVEDLATEAFEADLTDDRERLSAALDGISALGSEAYYASFVYWMEIFFDHAADGHEIKNMSLGGFTNVAGEKIALDDERVDSHMLWASRLTVAYARKDVEEYRSILDEIPDTEQGAAEHIYGLLHLLTMCRKKFPRGFALQRPIQPPTS